MSKYGKEKIAIIGLGYVGLPLAVEFGKKRLVYGFDIDQARIQQLREGKDATLEVSSEDIDQASMLEFTCSKEDLKDASVFIVTVPTPIDSVNRPDLGPLIKACELVGSLLNKGDLVIFESTVFPGCTEEVCVPVLENNSGLKYSKDFYCGYSPERVSPGDKINTLTKIKKITSGCTAEISKAVDYIYNEIISAGTFRAASIKVA